MILYLPSSPFSSVNFQFTYFQAKLFSECRFRVVFYIVLGETTFYCQVFHLISSNASAFKFTFSDII